jgi:glycerate 2-kinase
MSDLKPLARSILRDTLAAIDIPATMRRKLAPAGSILRVGDAVVDLAAHRRIVAVAIGKAAVPMARGFASLLATAVPLEGLLVAPREALAAGIQAAGVPGFRAIAAGHPVPDANSLLAARAILDLLHTCTPRDLIFFLLSGGGSALVELPLDSAVTLADLQELYRLLVGCGASIDEINAVRKHVSAVKGGRLSAAAPTAIKVTLGMTDVPAGCESALASGPTLPDPTSVADACRVLDAYALRSQLPAVFRACFDQPALIPETPKAGDSAFARSHFALLLGMRDLFHHAHRAAEALGFVTVCDNSTDDWPLADAAEYLLGQLERLGAAHPGRRVAVIADGELSSPVAGDGVGGRNSAFVLNCVERIAGKNFAVLSAGTDGRDGSSPAAGAVADGETLVRAGAARLDPRDFARRSDSYSFFRALGDTLDTGPTGNNLRDLRVLLAE